MNEVTPDDPTPLVAGAPAAEVRPKWSSGYSWRYLLIVAPLMLVIYLTVSPTLAWLMGAGPPLWRVEVMSGVLFVVTFPAVMTLIQRRGWGRRPRASS